MSGYVGEGGGTVLTCRYQLSPGQWVDSIKWYLNSSEIYRIVPSLTLPERSVSGPGQGGRLMGFDRIDHHTSLFIVVYNICHWSGHRLILSLVISPFIVDFIIVHWSLVIVDYFPSEC